MSAIKVKKGVSRRRRAGRVLALHVMEIVTRWRVGRGLAKTETEASVQAPAYQGRGRPPTQKQPQPGWHYMQVVKQREKRRVVGTETRVILSGDQLTPVLLREHMAYVERTNLTTRHMNGRLVRKMPGFSKQRDRLEAACTWEDVVYNFRVMPKHFVLRSMMVVAAGNTARWRWRQA